MNAAQLLDRASYYNNNNTNNQRTWIQTLLSSSKGAWTAAAIALLFLVYNAILRFDLVPLLPISELVWNALVYLTPASLVIALDRRNRPDMYATSRPEPSSWSEMHAAKGEALRRLLGLEGGALNTLPGASSLRRASFLDAFTSSRSDAPPGLGNWDNSCYQNSVLQGLSALRSLTPYLQRSNPIKSQDSSSTAGSLRETLTRLNDPRNNGRRIWTPAKLKSMSSWQQQDAQEYFSKIMDDMEKETAKALAASQPLGDGLKEVGKWTAPLLPASEAQKDTDNDKTNPEKNPLDGFLAQRVACLRCGFSEGLSMIPFNCLTVPLGNASSYHISQCLDSYTQLEDISGVECAKCTLLQQKTQLENMTKSEPPAEDPATKPSTPASSTVVTLPTELRQMVLARLEAVKAALDESDFSDNTLNKKCQVPKKSRVSSTKTRQAVIARAPQSLAIHVNRSMFDEYTGDQRKNYAEVKYPKVLDLGPWCLGTRSSKDEEVDEWPMDPAKSMIASSSNTAVSPSSHMQYMLRAAVCHYGRHENGHYICYREHPEYQEEEGAAGKMKWWRLSDDDVSPVTEEQVLAQGGVFMLFYERFEEDILPEKVEVQGKVEATKSMPVELERQSVAVVAEEAVPSTSNDHDMAPQLSDPGPDKATADAIPEAVASSPSRASDELANEPNHPLPDTKSMPPKAPMMRTARKGSKRGKGSFEPAFRAVAAT